MHVHQLHTVLQRGKRMITKYIQSRTNWLHLEPASVFDNRYSGEQTSQTTKQPSTDDSADSPSRPDSDPGPQSQPGSESPTADDLPLDQVFEILKNRRRRLVLHYLDENDGESSLSDLAEHIAAIENNTTVKAISSTQRKRVYVGLYQCHLPKMDDMNIIDFDQNRGTVVLSANAEQVKSYLGEPNERAWHKVYLGLTVAGAGLFAVSQLGAAQFGLTSSIVLVILLLTITGAGIVQAYGLDMLLADETN